MGELILSMGGEEDGEKADGKEPKSQPQGTDEQTRQRRARHQIGACVNDVEALDEGGLHKGESVFAKEAHKGKLKQKTKDGCRQELCQVVLLPKGERREAALPMRLADFAFGGLGEGIKALEAKDKEDGKGGPKDPGQHRGDGQVVGIVIGQVIGGALQDHSVKQHTKQMGKEQNEEPFQSRFQDRFCLFHRWYLPCGFIYCIVSLRHCQATVA